MEVMLSARAELQLVTNALWWAENRSTEQAVRWLDGFQQELKSLGDAPQRCPIAPESDGLPFSVRQLIYGLKGRKTHRAISEVRDEKIIVHAIRHLAQDAMSPDDFV